MVGLKSVISGADPDVNVPMVAGDYGSDSWRLYAHDGAAWKFVKIAAADPVDIPVPVDIADYGGSFSTYTPPAAAATQPHIRIVKDSNGVGAWRIYCHDGTAWKSAALT